MCIFFSLPIPADDGDWFCEGTISQTPEPLSEPIPCERSRKGRDKAAEATLSAPHGHPVRRSGCSSAEPYPPDGRLRAYQVWLKTTNCNPAGVGRLAPRFFALRDHAERGLFESFSVLCYRAASRLEEVLSTRYRVEAFITLSAGSGPLRSW